MPGAGEVCPDALEPHELYTCLLSEGRLLRTVTSAACDKLGLSAAECEETHAQARYSAAAAAAAQIACPHAPQRPCLAAAVPSMRAVRSGAVQASAMLERLGLRGDSVLGRMTVRLATLLLSGGWAALVLLFVFASGSVAVCCCLWTRKLPRHLRMRAGRGLCESRSKRD